MQHEPNHATPSGVSSNLATLMLGAIGVVYGDVGTSPLYTMKEIFNGPHGVVATADNVLGALSLIFWALIFVISVKYVLFVMRADNKGEGGIMALMALALRYRPLRIQRTLLVALGLAGTALFYGDGVITPAISVLSAVEGLQIAAPALASYVLPITIAVLIGLFSFQSKGTEKVGLLFGPIMLVWFAALAVLGYWSIQQQPLVLQALNPYYGWHFLNSHGWHAFVALGAVVLALTGAEALYADMGHFGKRPIQAAWFSLVLPALVMNYFGQGALILRDASAIENPFYRLVPEAGLYPMIALATVATVIASQAVISGAFSITRQAIQLDYIPRMQLVHTSTAEMGQIFVPAMNKTLLLVVIAVVIGFGSSGNLAAAYGIAVTGTMVITSVLALVVATDSWKWPPKTVAALALLFLSVDLAFFSANVLKIASGGWFPLVLGGLLYLTMTTWRRGREVLLILLKRRAISLNAFLDNLTAQPPLRVPGTAVYLTARQLSLPHALLRNFGHNQVLHEHVVLLTVEVDDVPRVSDNERLHIEMLEHGFYRISATFGFMETPDVPRALALCPSALPDADIDNALYFIGRETLLPSDQPELNSWQERIFLFLFRNASNPANHFKLPPQRVMEVGAQFEI